MEHLYSPLFEDNKKFIEDTHDSFLVQHKYANQRKRINEPSLFDLLFTTNEEDVENIDIYSPSDNLIGWVIKVKY